MADTAKTPGNPDTLLSMDDLVKKITTQADTIAKALAPLGEIARDADGKEVKPPKDTAGLNRLSTQAWCSQYQAQMKQYGGSSESAKDIRNASTALRKKLNEALLIAREMQEQIADADKALEAQARIFAESNGPKLQKMISKAELAIKKATERKEKLSKFATGGKAKKASA